MVKAFLTTVTRKGQITLPVRIRRALGIEEGDKIAVSIADPEKARVILEPVRPVAEQTFGAVHPRQRPEDLAALRASFEEELALRKPLDLSGAEKAEEG